MAMSSWGILQAAFLVVCWLLLVGASEPARAEEWPPVAVVFGQYSYLESPRGEGRNVRAFAKTVRAALDAVGVPYTVLTDESAETGGLLPYRVAIFPYNFVITPVEEEAVARYLEGGGKAVFLYAITERIAGLLGFQVADRKEGRFQTVRLKVERLPGSPEAIIQGSWNMRPAQPAAADAEVVGEWLDPDGRPLGEGALVISPRGAYMGHVLTEGDTLNKGRMLLALLSKLDPEAGRKAGDWVVSSAARRVEEMGRKVEAGRVHPDERGRSDPLLREARAKLAEAQGLAQQGQGAEAVLAAVEARRKAEGAYVLSSPERLGEFRATWLHDAYGVPGWGWERCIRELRDHGFNGIVVNMLWAGLAHYQSEVLPVSPRVAEQGDQIAEALRWCKQYGVELHIWKVNYNLATAPEEFVAKLRAEGRLQRHRDGSEILWLCPSDPRNFALERDSMLEVARKYDVAGIHFDYIRYLHDEACYCDGCRQRFEEAAGVKLEKWPDDVLAEPLREKYTQWRRDQITNLVRAVAAEARRIRPGLMVSAAVFSWPGALEWVNQDWRQWLEEGLLDFVCPMNYTANPDELAAMVTREVELVNGRVPLYIGTGEFIIPETHQLVDQLERARRLGADGFVCFSYEHLGPTEGRMAALHGAHTAHPTHPPHPAPRVQFKFSEGLAGQAGLTYRQGSPIGVEVTLAKEGNYDRPIRRVRGEVEVQTTEGRTVRQGRRPVSGGEPASGLSLSDLPPGRYRVAVRGAVSFSGVKDREFVVRSRPFEVVSAGQ